MSEQPQHTRVMLVDDTPARAAMLEQALTDCGFQVICRMASAQGLMKQVAEHQPDVVIVDIESPDRDMLEHMTVLNQHLPKPVIMFAEQGDSNTIDRAIRAGVSAYVVDGLNPERVRSIVDVAVARFREFQALRNELQQTRTRLADRQVIDKAKALLIQHRQMDEDEAYHAMRKLAMDRSQKLVDVANDIVSVLGLLAPKSQRTRDQ
ncbi:ANTAR domain-containing protein [Alloalcanivorax venustensis]|nr:ANTAR domain-containing protein [Alloalcanivorax venustensis]MEA3261143.1 ANTAR domain-containing protein [Pseudomonadota bacterium]MEC8880329.1 ANTAR domain-containing protein [Pseudomonadota bacterium]